MPGRLPDEVKKRRGTLRKGRQKENAPDIIPIDEDVPAFLLIDEIATRKFIELRDLLEGFRVLSKTDMDLLATMAIEYTEMVRCWKILRRQGRTYKSKNAYGFQIKPRPEYNMYKQHLFNVVKIGAHFGMSPASRGAVDMIVGLPQMEVNNDPEPESQTKSLLK